jgi:hypothetical protein
MRFDDLRKLPDYPAARFLSHGKVKLQTPLDLPAGASAAEMLEALSAQDALIDMLQVLAHALPAREATWWACLTAHDLGQGKTRAVQAAKAWVRQPGLETRIAAREAYDNAPDEDDTVFCAMAASFADGTMGPGEYEDYDAPPGAVGGVVFGLLLITLFDENSTPEDRGPRLLARGLDIARGGNGEIDTAREP